MRNLVFAFFFNYVYLKSIGGKYAYFLSIGEKYAFSPLFFIPFQSFLPPPPNNLGSNRKICTPVPPRAKNPQILGHIVKSIKPIIVGKNDLSRD